MPRLYDCAPSGNCYKVRLLLAQLRRPYERVNIDLLKGEGRKPAFKRRFPLGRIPVFERDDGTQLAESNAILWYLAEGTRYLPKGREARAEVLQWLFWEQYSHEPYVAVVYAWLCEFGVPKGKEKELEERRAKGVAALKVMEARLAKRPWFSGEEYGIADIALYAYTHVAPRADFDLNPFPRVRGFLKRVKAQPGHVEIEA
jgi:glutathione S-transferase